MLGPDRLSRLRPHGNPVPQAPEGTLRILYLNHNPAGVGTWQRASHLGRAMASRGHEVTLVTTHPGRRLGFETERHDSYTELRAPDLLWGSARTGWDPTNAIRRVLRLRGQQVELVHAFDARPVVIAPALDVVRRTGAAFFLDWADWWGRGGRIDERSGWFVRTLFGPIETWFEEAFRTRADGTTTTSHALAERAAALGVPADRIWTLPNGCDPHGIRPGDKAQARAALAVPPDAALVLHAGVLTPSDMTQLTTAFRGLVGALPSAMLVLVGNHTAPVPMELAQNRHVRVVGFVAKDEFIRWLAAADVCVIPLTNTPNNRGRWPGRLNDYLAAGRPTVMPRVGDAAALLEEHRAGWTCAPDGDALARSLLEALGHPDEGAACGARARALAEGQLAWSILAERLEAAYNAILAGRLASAFHGWEGGPSPRSRIAEARHPDPSSNHGLTDESPA